MQRQNISSGAPWEAKLGYSRAVRIGPHVWVTGTVAVGPDGKVVGAGDVHAQSVQAFKIIEMALTKAGAKLTDVVRTRVFLTDISRWQEAGRAHAELFADIRPALTMLEVSRLIAPEFLVEIEADAFVLS